MKKSRVKELLKYRPPVTEAKVLSEEIGNKIVSILEEKDIKKIREKLKDLI